MSGEGIDPAYVATVRAVLLGLGGLAAASDRTAATLYGWGLLHEPTRVVELALPHGWSVQERGIIARQRRSPSRSRLRVLPGTDRLRLTSPVQTVLDCALGLPLLEAVVVCDSALRSGRLTVEELLRASARLPGLGGAGRVRAVLELCDPLSGSVLESVLRVRMTTAGLTGFTTQAVLAPAPVMRVDFCFAEARLVVEADGATWHRDPARDQVRDNRLAVLGWRVLRFTWVQVVHEPDQVLAAVEAALTATATVHPPAATRSQVA